MLESLIVILVAALVGYVIYFLVGLFIKDGTAMKVIGIIIGLLFLLFALRELGVGGNLIK